MKARIDMVVRSVGRSSRSADAVVCRLSSTLSSVVPHFTNGDARDGESVERARDRTMERAR
jgi:hypothetical protein